MSRLHCPLLRVSLYLISSSPVNMSVVQIKHLGFWTTVFYFGQFGSNLRGKFHPPTAQRSSYLVMLDLDLDSIEDSHTELQRTQQVLQFSFDVGRSRPLFHTPLLVVTYMVHQYNWLEVGIFVFLTATYFRPSTGPLGTNIWNGVLTTFLMFPPTWVYRCSSPDFMEPNPAVR